MTETLEMGKQSRQQQNATEGSENSISSGQFYASHAALRLAQSALASIACLMLQSSLLMMYQPPSSLIDLQPSVAAQLHSKQGRGYA